jgi:signal transduction histidine kinase
MVQGLLHLTRIESKGRALRPVASGGALEAALGGLRIAIEEARAAVDYEALPMVLADEPQLVEVFQNLVANAIRYRGEAPPRIHVGAKREDRMWRFAVSDNGLGIARSDAERVFEMFFKSRRDGPGLGIGLALVRRIVERHGGRTWFETEPGTGSTFYFTLRPVDGPDGPTR